MHSITFNDLGAAFLLTDEQIDAKAAPVLDALRAIEDVTGKDPSGIARRGGCVYDEVLEGRFSVQQLAAARRWLSRHQADMRVLDSVEGARGHDESKP
jgi:hypothetical protein